MTVGRNDPCPCGSGRKFKRCCQGIPDSSADRSDLSVQAQWDRLASLFDAGLHDALQFELTALLQRNPAFGEGWKLLSASLLAQGKEALVALEQAVRCLPQDAALLNHLGLAYCRAGRLDVAEATFRRALRLQPASAQILCNLGNVLKELGKVDEAKACYLEVIDIAPDFHGAHYNLGIIAAGMGDPAAAIGHYESAIKTAPTFAEARCNLGNVLLSLHRIEDAEVCYRRALDINPGLIEAQSNLSHALSILGRVAEALQVVRRVVERCPDFPPAHNNLGNLLRDQGKFAEAEESYRRAMNLQPGFFDAHSNLLLTLNYSGRHTAEECFEEACRFGADVASRALPFDVWPGARRERRGAPLRVGFVSGDLRQHSVGHFLEGLLAHIDPARLTLLAFPTQVRVDALTHRIRPRFAEWLPLVGLNDRAAAGLIRDRQVDILVDLSGHTAHNRLPLFAWRAAPMQVSWLGYLGTTGLKEMDWYLADVLTMAADDEIHFTERVWRMPKTYVCFTPPATDSPVAQLPALSNGHVTFGSFNNLSKLNEEVVALWSRLILAIPDSRLFLKAHALAEVQVQDEVATRFGQHGLAKDRLILEGFTPTRVDHLAAYDKVDIALDPFPYPGVTTSVEALWMGVPVLSMAGDRFISRQGLGLLTNMGLTDWIAKDAEAFINMAVQKSADLTALAALRASLRSRALASPVFDTPRFAREFEEALQGMVDNARP